MCTSFSTAWRAASSGVGEQRADVDVEAEVGERAWRSPSGRGRGRPGPSWRPGCAGAGRRSSRTPRPCAARGRRSLFMAASLRSCRRRKRPGWFARCRPNTFSIASEISPTVALARAAAMLSSSRLPLPRAPSVERVERGARRPSGSRSALRRCSLAIWRSRTRLLSIFSTSISASFVDAVLVDADDGLLAAVDARLRAGGGFLDAQLGDAGGDRLGHAAQALDLARCAPCALRASS